MTPNTPQDSQTLTADEALVSPWREIDEHAKTLPQIWAYSETGCTDVMLVRWIAPCDFLTETEMENWVSEGYDADNLDVADWFVSDFCFPDRLSPDCYPTHYFVLPELPSRSALNQGQG